jgi:HemY protein
MRGTLILLFLVIVVGGWLGTLISRDPGYVLISYGGASIQTSLWVFLVLLLSALAGTYYLLRWTSALLRTGDILHHWRQRRRRAKALELTAKGQLFLQQGVWERAEKFLVSGAQHSDTAASNFIAAARAADAQEHLEQRERYLRQALDADPRVKESVALVRAEMHLARGEWSKALASIEDLGNTKVTLALRKQAMLQLRDWQGLADIMTDLRKQADNPASQLEFEKKVAQQRFASPNNTDETMEIMFNRLPEALRQDPELVIDYSQRVRDERQVEGVLRGAIKHRWDDSLVIAYGHGVKETLAKRIKTAEGWQKAHPDNSALQASLGQLYEGNGEKDRAKAAFQKSLQIQPSVLAHERLAKLLAFDGEYAKSSDHLRQALQITETATAR